MHAAHTQGVENFLIGNLLDSILPESVYLRAVIHIVIFSIATARPLPCRVASHRLTMRPTYIYAISARHLAVPLCQEKRHRAFMHRRPESIGTQPEHQLKYPGACLGPYFTIATLRLIIVAAPRHQPPVLVIYENAAICHRRRVIFGVIRGQGKLLTGLRLRVCPPFPWRNTKMTAQLKHSVCSAMTVAARNENRAVIKHFYSKCLPFSVKRVKHRINAATSASQILGHPHDHVAAILHGFSCHANHLFQIAAKHLYS